MDLLQRLLAGRCPGWTRVWGITIKCKLPARHRGDHRNGRRTWPYGE